MTNSNDKPKAPDTVTHPNASVESNKEFIAIQRQRIDDYLTTILDPLIAHADMITGNNYGDLYDHQALSFSQELSEGILEKIQSAISEAERDGRFHEPWRLARDGSLWAGTSDWDNDPNPQTNVKFQRLCTIPIDTFFPRGTLREVLNVFTARHSERLEIPKPRWGTVEEVKKFREQLKETL